MTVEEIVALLATGADVGLGAGLAVSQLDHALQTAQFVAAAHPDDPELVAAALVHDLGHLLPGTSDEAHAQAGADAVRPVLGDRVAALVDLHVEAKRYLVAVEGWYRDRLAADSTSSLARQGGALSRASISSFRANPLADDALELRRADDRAKEAAARVEPLSHWVPLLQTLSRGGGRARA